MDAGLLQDLIGRHDQDLAWWQMCVRAILILLFGLVLVRVAGKRLFGKWGAIDILVSIIIGSNLSRAITGNAPFFSTLAATATLLAAHALLTMLAVRLPWLGPLLKGKAHRIVKDGEPDPREMLRHGVGRHDLEEALRGAGVTRCEDAQEAWIERNGDISVIERKR